MIKQHQPMIAHEMLPLWVRTTYQSSSWWLPAFEFEAGDASVSSFISTLPCFFIFSCLRHFALLFWNHTCTLASVKSIRFMIFSNTILIRWSLVSTFVTNTSPILQWRHQFVSDVTNMDLKNFLSEIFSGVNVRIVSFLKHSFELSELRWSKSRPDEKSLGSNSILEHQSLYNVPYNFAQRNIPSYI